MLTVIFLLAIVTFLGTLASAFAPQKCPLWVPVLLLAIIALLSHIPLGRS
jgi:hypothetical protein